MIADGNARASGQQATRDSSLRGAGSDGPRHESVGAEGLRGGSEASESWGSGLPETDGTVGHSGGAPPELVSALCHALEAAQLRYCHWKSNEGLHRSLTAENDLDLLVSRSDLQRFDEILKRLGFKDAQMPPWKHLPGVSHSYGLDRTSGKLVHIHAHYQLVIGDDMTKNYHLPIEEPYLESTVPGTPIRIPSPEIEFAVFLVRMVLKHCSWDALLTLQGSLSATERRELTYLLAKVDTEAVWALMAGHLPFVPREVWESSLKSVQPGCSIWFRIRTARRLGRRLVACSRRRMAIDTYLKMWRRFRTLFARKLLRRGPVLPRRLSAAGVLIAIVGGDGAGKSTAVEDLSNWLGEDLLTRTVHLGKPPRSLLSAVLKKLMGLAASVHSSPTSSASALKASLAASSGSPMAARSYARMAWEVLTARDRYRAYSRARRLATNGAIVVCDRFPLPEIKLMDGAVTGLMEDHARRGRLLEYLARLEKSFYDRISYPDVLIVLRVDPDLAVSRKREERESFLRPRSEEIWKMDWRTTRATVIDAARPQAQVLSEIKSVVWSRL